MTLKLHLIGPFLYPADLNSFVLEASNDIQYQINQSSVKAASSTRGYTYKSDDGFVLELWSRSLSPKGYPSLGELRSIIDGLSLYMMQGRGFRAVQFQVVQNLGATKVVIKSTGSIRPDVALPNSRAKRAVSPSRLIQDSYALPIPAPPSVGNLSLLTADHSNDFPIPHTHFSLRFGNLGSYLHLWDLETLLMAVGAEVEGNITAHGRDARLPSTEYSKRAVGLEFWIRKMPWDALNLAWAEVAIVVEGLRLYIVDGRHDRETFIDVINHDRVRQVALGWIGKPHTALGHASSTDAIGRGLEVPASRQTS